MQSVRGYGFILEAPLKYLEEEYQEWKAEIERICCKAEELCNNVEVIKANFALLAKEEVFISVSVYDGVAQFGLYDKGNDRLNQECNIFDFKRYVTKGRLDALELRIEKECKAIASGRELDRKNLDKAWNRRYAENEQDVIRQNVFQRRGR